MNSFVRYLDQFNVLSPNHAKIYDEYTQNSDEYRFSIDTKIEAFLLRIFSEAPRSVIMTGNAGDGKTRLCRTIYEKLTGSILHGWPPSGIVEASFPNGTLRIVKDLSELTEPVIYGELERLQQIVAEGHASRIYYLIAANEGKLTKFLSQHASLKPLYGMVEQRFLDHRRNDNQFHLVNLQDVTSSIYAGRIIEAWNQEDNWRACESCSKQRNCIISLNHRRMSKESVKRNLIEQYRMLDCLGTHVTMREILIHISYVMTGGLTCEDVLNADYRSFEEHAKRAYYDNFYGLQIPENISGEMSAVRYFRRLDPGKLSISAIDDFLLHGDISGDETISAKHRELFSEEIDLLFGYYRKLIELHRTHNPDRNADAIFDQMPKFRRKYFFEFEEQGQAMRRKLIPYISYYRFVECLEDKQTHQSIRRELIQGLNHAFSKKLINRSESQLFVVNENLLIHGEYSSTQVRLSIDSEREDIDYLPSRFYLTVNQEVTLEVQLPVFEYLIRLAGGGLFITLKQEVEILLSTFKNDLINRCELDEFSLTVFAIDQNKGVYGRYQIDI